MARRVRRALGPEEKRRQVYRRGIGLALGVATFLFLGSLIFYLRLRSGPVLPPAARARMPAGPAASTGPEALTPAEASKGEVGPSTTYCLVPPGTPRFAQQIAEVAQAASTGDTRPRRLYLTEAELTQELRQRLGSNPAVRDVQAYFEQGQAYLTGRAIFKGREWHITLVFEPVVHRGAVHFELQKIYLGRIAAPAGLEIVQKLRAEVAKRSNWLTPERTGLYVERITLQSGVAILEGRPIRY